MHNESGILMIMTRNKKSMKTANHFDYKLYNYVKQNLVQSKQNWIKNMFLGARHWLW